MNAALPEPDSGLDQICSKLLQQHCDRTCVLTSQVVSVFTSNGCNEIL